MEKINKVFILTVLFSMVCIHVYAYSIVVANSDGVKIYYDFINNEKEVSVVGKEYSGAVVIPETVTYLGKTYSVTSIGDNAFYDCTGLTSITIPNSVTSIGRYAFWGCTGLTSITIPNSVTTIGESVCAYCSNLISITIPNSVTTIGKAVCAYCSNLISVTIPNSVTSIGAEAFKYCNNLRSITIGSGVLSIGYEAFSHKNACHRKVIWLTNTLPSGWGQVDSGTTYVASKPDNTYYYEVYPFLSSIFEVDGVKYVPVSPSDRTCDAIDCNYDSSAENINIGETVTYKGVTMSVRNVKEYVCYRNPFIKDVNISNKGYVDQYAFSGCESLETVTLSNQGNVGFCAFIDCTFLRTAKLSNQGNVGVNAFRDCTSLRMVTLNNHGNVSGEAFYGCTKLETATLNNHGNVYGEAFYGCTKLKTATLGNQVTSIGSSAFEECSSLGRINIPDAVTTIGKSAFEGCTSMTSAKIGSGVTEINKSTFSNCSSLKDIQIGVNVTKINDEVFLGCSKLSSIRIPKSVQEIGNSVFRDCIGLKQVVMEDGESSLNLGKWLFSSCPLDSVYIGRNISYSTSSSEGYSPFYRNTWLRSVKITNKETEISPNEFYGCTNLQNVYIGDGVTTIGDWAFSGCSSLGFFACGSSVETIGKEAFSDCTAMTKFISNAPTPPTCGSQALDDINKWTCTLQVPGNSASLYQAAPQWKEFFFVEDIPTGITFIERESKREDRVYDVDGRHLSRMHKGINIIKSSDGTTRKVLVR